MGTLIGYSSQALEEINIRGIEFYRDIARDYDSAETPMIVGGAIGPRADAYQTGAEIDAASAEDYHAKQIATLKKAGADMITRSHFSSVEEAIGISRALASADIPIVVSFFVKDRGAAQEPVECPHF